jgi:hypothetical protein
MPTPLSAKAVEVRRDASEVPVKGPAPRRALTSSCVRVPCTDVRARTPVAVSRPLGTLRATPSVATQAAQCQDADAVHSARSAFFTEPEAFT